MTTTTLPPLCAASQLELNLWAGAPTANTGDEVGISFFVARQGSGTCRFLTGTPMTITVTAGDGSAVFTFSLNYPEGKELMGPTDWIWGMMTTIWYTACDHTPNEYILLCVKAAPGPHTVTLTAGSASQSIPVTLQ